MFDLEAGLDVESAPVEERADDDELHPVDKKETVVQMATANTNGNQLRLIIIEIPID